MKSVVAALLHDVVEDTEYTVEDMERIFGPKIASMVDGLTKMSGVFNAETSEQAEYFRKVLLTLSDDVRVILIKIADRLHNMRTLGGDADEQTDQDHGRNDLPLRTAGLPAGGFIRSKANWKTSA